MALDASSLTLNHSMSPRSSILTLLFAGLLAPAAVAQGPSQNWVWPEAAPQTVGLDPRVLAALDADLASGRYGHVDGLLIVRHGRIAFERTYRLDYDSIYGERARADSSGPLDPTGPYSYYNTWWHPYYQRGDLHTLQSVTKAITSIVIGVAVGRGEFPSIDTPILSFFDSGAVANIDDRKRRVTIRHLQTMTAGLDWDESGPADHVSQMEQSFDWVRFAIDRPMAHEPGSVYNYNSGATQLLSYVFRRATGRDIEEYAAEHLFASLGITRWFWKRSPTGLADTEGGLYLTPRDVAKLAQLYLRDGRWGGRPVVPAEWVRATLAPSVALPDRGDATGVRGGFNVLLYPYGTGGAHYAFSKSGYGGQNMIGVPELDLVIVYTGWTVPRRMLSTRVALDRVLEAVVDESRGMGR